MNLSLRLLLSEKILWLIDNWGWVSEAVLRIKLGPGSAQTWKAFQEEKPAWSRGWWRWSRWSWSRWPPWTPSAAPCPCSSRRAGASCWSEMKTFFAAQPYHDLGKSQVKDEFCDCDAVDAVSHHKFLVPYVLVLAQLTARWFRILLWRDFQPFLQIIKNPSFMIEMMLFVRW